jgi:hypothetical protein
MIPMVFHFSYFRGSKSYRWKDFHTLCLKTCQIRAGAEKIVIHYDRDGEGPDWEEAKALPGIEWRLTELDWKVNGIVVTDQRLQHDIHRLRVLNTEGGWYADLDFVFLKNFEALRHNQAIIGIQCKQKAKLNCALLGCIPGSKFMAAYLESYKEWTPEHEIHTWAFANSVPWKLSRLYPVTVVDRAAFYPVAWTNKGFWNGRPVPLYATYAVHLWESMNPDLSVEKLYTSGMALEMTKVLKEKIPAKESIVFRSGTLTFD